jgi:rare lipoprotein A
MRSRQISVILCAVACAFGLSVGAACAADDAGSKPGTGGDKPSGPTFSGNASWYGPGFDGKKTASGEIFDMKKSTAAHLKLPFHTKVLVEDPRTGKSVVVKVNDRGPYAKKRIMDLSKGAAQKLGTLLGGVAFVECTVIGKEAKASLINPLIISQAEPGLH